MFNYWQQQGHQPQAQDQARMGTYNTYLPQQSGPGAMQQDQVRPQPFNPPQPKGRPQYGPPPPGGRRYAPPPPVPPVWGSPQYNPMMGVGWQAPTVPSGYVDPIGNWQASPGGGNTGAPPQYGGQYGGQYVGQYGPQQAQGQGVYAPPPQGFSQQQRQQQPAYGWQQ